jgi:hypothetical protein
MYLGVITRFLDESPRWLLVNNRIPEAERIIRKAARLNKVKYEDVIKKVELKRLRRIDTHLEMQQIFVIRDTPSLPKPGHHANDTSTVGLSTKQAGVEFPVGDEDKSDVQRFTILDILRKKKLLRNSIILWFAW